ncbi:MAG: SIMPL domain-containing protein, partial [Roseobacter sp.]
MIVTTGTATVEAEPDMATLRVGVAREARLAGDALQLTSDAMTTVLARLKDAGIEDRDMQTQGLSLQPVWSQQSSTSSDPRRITGFVARNGLVIRVRSLENLGGLLDLVVQDGANTFDGLSFSVQEQEALLAKARADAVRDAIEK